MDLDAALAPELARREAQGLYRRRVVVDGPQRVEPVIGGRRYLAFCSNDYLGLADHPAVVAAFCAAAAEYGVGSGASHLVLGHLRPHHELEEALADFTGRPRALLFSTGYMANLSIAGALTGRSDHVFEDRLNHASLVDAGQLSRARAHRYRHADPAALDLAMAGAGDGRKLVLTDAVFSMDGDLAPLRRLAEVTAAHDGWLAADDAHGLGVLGAGGRGSLEVLGLGSDQVPILMGTLGKALGTFGAFVAGDEGLIESLVQQARPYIYTTALPPAVAAATLASLRLAAEDRWRREHLRSLVQQFRRGLEQLGLSPGDNVMPIQPLLLGTPARALEVSAALRERGIWVTAIRPPTVPAGTARLRITFSAAHDDRHVQRLLDALAEALA